MLQDKKSSSTQLNLVLIKDVSKPFSEEGKYFCKSEPDKVKSFLDDFLKNYDYKINECSKFLQRDHINYSLEESL